MVVDRERFLLLAAALSASQLAAKSADLPGAAPSTSAAATASAPAVASTPGFCAEVARHNDLLLSQPSGWCEGHGGEIESLRAEVAKQRETAPFLHYCHQGKGTWAVMLVSVALTGPGGESGGCGWEASYKLVFQPTPTTPLHDCAMSVRHEWGESTDEHSSVSKEIIFDYDGDGKDELILAHDQWENGAGTTSSVELLRGDGPRETVVPYDVGFTFDGVQDADRDGRPDLLQATFQDPTGCGMSGHTYYGAPLLVHSLRGGTFSMSDDVARRWAVSVCPTALPAANATTSCDFAASCQRLWGRSKEEVNAWALAAPVCKEVVGCHDGGTAAATFAAVPLPFAPLNVSTPAPLPASKPLVPPPASED